MPDNLIGRMKSMVRKTSGRLTSLAQVVWYSECKHWRDSASTVLHSPMSPLSVPVASNIHQADRRRCAGVGSPAFLVLDSSLLREVLLLRSLRTALFTLIRDNARTALKLPVDSRHGAGRFPCLLMAYFRFDRSDEQVYGI